MRKNFILVIVVGIIFSSCTDYVSNEEIAKRIELIYSENIEQDENNTVSIISKNHTINDNKYYFNIKKKNPKKNGPSGLSMTAYVDLASDILYLLCQDPLCRHEDTNDCRMLGLEDVFFIDDGVFYTWDKAVSPVQLLCVDINQNRIENVYSTQSYIVFSLGYDKISGHYYFCEVEEKTNEDKSTELIYYLYKINKVNHQITELGLVDNHYLQNLFTALFIYDDEIYSVSDGKLWKSDIEFSYMTELYVLEPGYMINQYQWYYDQSTNELFFIASNASERKGKLYHYNNNIVTQIYLPHEEIYSFCLTQEEIYYSTYEPVYYGVSASPNQEEVYDLTGGKIFVTKRNDPSAVRLVYDNNGEYLICNSNHNYIIIGDYLYFDEIMLKSKIINGVEYTYFSSAEQVNKIRINLITGELTRFLLE